MEIDELVYLPSDLSKYILVDNRNANVDPGLKTLLNSLKDRGLISSDAVYQAMSKVDRKNYVTEDMYHNAYADSPKPIGWNTTISAPHMHAMTLEKLCPKLKKGGKALDLGAGSGYVAACFAEMMGKDCKVYMIDHIKDIVDFAIKNISKQNKHLLLTKKIIPLTMDGRKGLVEHGPYDVIHVGGAMP